MFDLFSRAGTNDDGDATITAETYGGPFRVYSTKDFPGLPASTALTKVRVLPTKYDRIFLLYCVAEPRTMGCTVEY